MKVVQLLKCCTTFPYEAINKKRRLSINFCLLRHHHSRYQSQSSPTG